MKLLTNRPAFTPLKGPFSSGSGRLPGTNFRVSQEYKQQFRSLTERSQFASAVAAWVDGILKADHAGIYFSFVVTCSTVRTPAMIVSRVSHACVETSRHTFPELSRCDSRRHPSDKSAAVILLPAVSAAGLAHVHGFVRIPLLAISPDAEDVPIRIHEACATKVIHGPQALGTFVRNLRNRFRPRAGSSTSVWIANIAPHHGSRAEAAGHIKHPQVSANALAYLQNTADGEVRRWTDVALCPKAVFKRIREHARTAPIQR